MWQNSMGPIWYLSDMTTQCQWGILVLLVDHVQGLLIELLGIERSFDLRIHQQCRSWQELQMAGKHVTQFVHDMMLGRIWDQEMFFSKWSGMNNEYIIIYIYIYIVKRIHNMPLGQTVPGTPPQKKKKLGKRKQTEDDLQNAAFFLPCWRGFQRLTEDLRSRWAWGPSWGLGHGQAKEIWYEVDELTCIFEDKVFCTSVFFPVLFHLPSLPFGSKP